MFHNTSRKVVNDLSPNFHFKDHRQNNKQNKNKNPKNHKNKNHKKTKQNKTHLYLDIFCWNNISISFSFKSCRPKKAHTLDPNFSTRSRPKKTRPKYPDYIAEITAPLAKEEDFDFMIMPAFYNSQVIVLQ